MRIQTEIDWHEKLLANLDKLETPPSRPDSTRS